MQIAWSRFIPQQPTAKQHLACMLDDVPELLYGGAAGGGKSEGLAILALQYVDHPDYACLILRRTFPMLCQPGGLIPRLSEWLAGTSAEPAETVNGYPTRYDFPSGAVVKFGHMQHLRDRENYQGGEYTTTCWDELGQFLEPQYKYVAFSRERRKADSPLPIRVRSATNPGSAWVKQRWGPEGGLANGRAFLPARIRDNPHLDADAYIKSLSELDPVTRAQLLDGDWSVRPEGGLFKREDMTFIDQAPKGNRKLVRYWDMAATVPKAGTDPDYSVGTLISYQPTSEYETEYTVEDVQRFRLGPAETTSRIRSICRQDGHDTETVIEQEPGSSGKIVTNAFIRQLAGYNVRADRPSGAKFNRAQPFSAQVGAGNVSVVRGSWLSDWVEELECFPTEGAHDDQVDSASGAFARLKGGVSDWERIYGGENEPARPAPAAG